MSHEGAAEVRKRNERAGARLDISDLQKCEILTRVILSIFMPGVQGGCRGSCGSGRGQMQGRAYKGWGRV